MSEAKAVGGQFVTWDGGCIFVGEWVGVVPMHAHYAIQIAFGSLPGLRFRSSDGEAWTTYDGAIIASRQPHSMDTTGLPVPGNAVLFVEPETREGRVLAERHVSEGIVPMSSDAVVEGQALVADWASGAEADAIRAGAWRVIRALTGQVEPAVVSDERILRAVAYVNANIGSDLSLEQVASEANLSPSRFRHVFVEQTGMGLRPYILWRRFLRVWALLQEGETLSGAAHRAGFADAAHLSRTSRKMFGIPPSAMGLLSQTRHR